MLTTVIIGRIVGTFLFVAGLAMLMDTTHYRKVARELIQKPALIMIGGIITFLVGLTIITFHNIWMESWEVVVTLVGWAILLSGALRLLFPKVILRFGKEVSDRGLLAIFWTFLIVGAYLMYMTYFYVMRS